MGLVLRLTGQLRGDEMTVSLQDRLAKELVRSGWPHHGRNWRNLHASRFLWNAYQSSKGARVMQAKRQPKRELPLRTGVVGSFSRAFTFPPELFAAAPSDLELVFFDIPWAGEFPARYLVELGEYVVQVVRPESRAADLTGLGQAISDADVDMLLVLHEDRNAYDLLDHISCPCVVDIALGAGIMSHPAISYHVHAEREADYFVAEGRMFCGTTRRPLDDDLVFPGWACYDRRGIDPATRRPLAERDPLMIFHGALYKANSPPYLDALFRLMHDDQDLEFVLMGHDWDGERKGGALDPILERARRAGLASRVHYDGEYHPIRNETAGDIVDANWIRLRDHLDRARLAPNPWPIGGASSRIEAYLSGVPVPHLGVRTDPGSWGLTQHGGGEIPILVLESTTTWTPEGYVELSRRMLYEEEFREGVVADQLDVAEHATDREAYWQFLLDCYRTWVGPAD
jgi:hypothetical protein